MQVWRLAEALQHRGLIDPRDLDGLPTAGEAVGMVREQSPPGTRPATDALAALREEETEY